MPPLGFTRERRCRSQKEFVRRKCSFAERDMSGRPEGGRSRPARPKRGAHRRKWILKIPVACCCPMACPNQSPPGETSRPGRRFFPDSIGRRSHGPTSPVLFRICVLLRLFAAQKPSLFPPGNPAIRPLRSARPTCWKPANRLRTSLRRPPTRCQSGPIRLSISLF